MLSENIAEECEQFVDDNGQKIIDALVKDQLNPRQVQDAQKISHARY